MCIDGVAFTPDARTIATRTVDNAMKFWNVATGREIFSLGPLNPVHSFLFLFDGEYGDYEELRNSRRRARGIVERAFVRGIIPTSGRSRSRLTKTKSAIRAIDH